MDDFMVKPIETNALNAILLRWIPLEKQEKVKSAGDGENFEGGTEKALPAIDGLDAALGLSRSNGQREAYLTTLEYFRKDALISLSNLNASLENREYRDFAIHIHALKSAAGVTGATELAARAAALEAASIAGAEGFIAGNIASFRQDLLRLIDGLTRYFEDLKKDDGEKRLSKDDEEALQELKNLRDSLPAMDGARIGETLTGLMEKTSNDELKRSIAELDRLYREVGIEALVESLDKMLTPETVH
jgi:HPt (histidine-containing phosphotransfer) domain-containing protein